jgi:hypothetical protein
MVHRLLHLQKPPSGSRLTGLRPGSWVFAEANVPPMCPDDPDATE